MSALKFDGDKPRPELLSPDALLAISQVLAVGARKYADHNWRGGFAWSRLLGAAMRHLLAYMGGEDKDPETGLSHMAHLGCCVMFLLEHESRKLGTDDRYKHVAPVKQFQNPPLCDDDDPTIRFEVVRAKSRLENDPATELWRHNGMGVPFIK